MKQRQSGHTPLFHNHYHPLARPCSHTFSRGFTKRAIRLSWITTTWCFVIVRSWHLARLGEKQKTIFEQEQRQAMQSLPNRKRAASSVAKTSTITLDISGRIFRVSKELLLSSSRADTPLAALATWPSSGTKKQRISSSRGGAEPLDAEETGEGQEKKEEGESTHFFDRDPAVFEDVLRYLRTGILQMTKGVDLRILVQEWEYWSVWPTQEFMFFPSDTEEKTAEDSKDELQILVEKVDAFLDELLAPNVVKQWEDVDSVNAHSSQRHKLPTTGPGVAAAGHTTSLALPPHTTNMPLHIHFGMKWDSRVDIPTKQELSAKSEQTLTLDHLAAEEQAYYRLALHDSIKDGIKTRWPPEHDHCEYPKEVDPSEHEVDEEVLKRTGRYVRKLHDELQEWLMDGKVQRMMQLRLARRGWLGQGQIRFLSFLALSTTLI